MGECFVSIEYEYIGRLILAVILGGVIGYERESAHRPAGLRTNILVCLGATLIMLLESYYHTKHPNTSDNLRMAAQVITGIGFLGAGTIIQTRSSIRGLTTAATIWVTATVGLSIGEGFYYVAIVATILVLISLRVLKKIENALAMKRGRILMISGVSNGNFSERLTDILKEMNIPMWDMRFSVTNERAMEMNIRIPAHVDIETLINKLLAIDGVHRVTTEILTE